MKVIKGNIVDIHNREIFPGKVYFKRGFIERIERCGDNFGQYILPGFIDSHVHIESSMVVPSLFSRLVVPRGTIGVLTDPHEIGNVLGVEGVEYMIDDAKNTPLKIFFGAPSCVPATNLESSGAIIDCTGVDYLLNRKEVCFLSEMMNYVGVINNDKEVWKKIRLAQKRRIPIDGHAPGIGGEELNKYASAGISTDHECFTLKEALDKIKCGMKIQIREGSAAKNFEALVPLFNSHPDSLMLCTDDSHPHELIKDGHIDKLIKLGLKKGVDLYDLLRAASLNPVEHYNLPVGLLREGDKADFIVIDNLDEFNVKESYIDGEKVFDHRYGVLFDKKEVKIVNQFKAHEISLEDIKVMVPQNASKVNVIQCFDGSLVTDALTLDIWDDKVLESCADKDILKIVVVDRYKNKPASVGFIKGFGFKKGAIASSVAHDSHNVVAVGVEDEHIVNALNLIMENKGGLSVSSKNNQSVLPLPIGGIMSNQDGIEVGKKYANIEKMAVDMGCNLKSPFMTLSFMSLLVIPKLKIGDKGLFDGEKFEFISLFN